MIRPLILSCALGLLLSSGLAGLLLPAAPGGNLGLTLGLDPAFAKDGRSGGSDDGKGDDKGHGKDDDKKDDDGKKDDDKKDDDKKDDGTEGHGRDASAFARTGADGRLDLRNLQWQPGLWRLYADGSRERLANGRYERQDHTGRVIAQRRATAADRAGFTRIGRGENLEAVAELRGDGLTITDRAGWQEELRGGTYRLTDPRGNLVTRRAATPDDIARILQSLIR